MEDIQTTARRLLRDRETANAPLGSLATTAVGARGLAQSARAHLAAAHSAEVALTGADSTQDALAGPATALLDAADAFSAAGQAYLAAVGPSPRWLEPGSGLHAQLAALGLAKP